MKDVSFFVIEDHSLTNLGIRQCIENSTGFSCAGFASTEQEAFEKLTELSLRGSLPSVIVLDLFLGGDSGVDVLCEVVRHFPDVNVIVYSMYSNPGIVNLVLESGARGFVSKSSAESELIEAVRKIAAGEKYVQKSLLVTLNTYKNVFASLTKTEQSIFKKAIGRATTEQISCDLAIAPNSVLNYLSRIYAKTGCRNQDELVARFG